MRCCCHDIIKIYVHPTARVHSSKPFLLLPRPAAPQISPRYATPLPQLWHVGSLALKEDKPPMSVFQAVPRVLLARLPNFPPARCIATLSPGVVDAPVGYLAATVVKMAGAEVLMDWDAVEAAAAFKEFAGTVTEVRMFSVCCGLCAVGVWACGVCPGLWRRKGCVKCKGVSHQACAGRWGCGWWQQPAGPLSFGEVPSGVGLIGQRNDQILIPGAGSCSSVLAPRDLPLVAYGQRRWCTRLSGQIPLTFHLPTFLLPQR